MAIGLYWDNDELTTLLCVFDGRWTWDELYATIRTIKNITEDVNHEVAAIIDIRKGMSFPGGSPLNAHSLENAKKLLKMGESGTGVIYIVGANALIKTVYETMHALNPKVISKVLFTDSVRQAREMLTIRKSA